MKTEVKKRIVSALEQMKKDNLTAIESLKDTVSLTAYEHMTYVVDEKKIWTKALQAALNEHNFVMIAPSENIYWIDDTVIIPSDRHIEAEGAVIRLTPDCEVLMLRNTHTMDGTHAPIDTSSRDRNISIHGGRWEESRTGRGGYGRNCRYTRFGAYDDSKRPFFGVSTCMLFNNLTGLTLTDMTFAHTAGFAVQTGDIENGVFENITFDTCYADGLHLNGNSKNLLIRQVQGEVGDDLVALNMYDWQNSSVNFGPTRNVLCDGLDLAASSPYKALRIEPGIYTYDDGTAVDCGLFDAIIRNVKGISTFKMYFQTPRYKIGTSPEPGSVGSSDNLFFENISIDLASPIDRMREYMDSDPLRGTFAAFELGANIGYVCFENIDLTLYPEKYPMSCLACIGPKSIRDNEFEIFDPYLSSHAGTVEMKNIRINGISPGDSGASIPGTALFRMIVFDNINFDGNSTGSGTVDNVILDGEKIL